VWCGNNSLYSHLDDGFLVSGTVQIVMEFANIC
jgi:hypothetical protein